MNDRNFMQLLKLRWLQNKFVCVGLDSDVAKIPKCIQHKHVGNTILAFNKIIIDHTKDIAGVYKPNIAFYSSRGSEGIEALLETIIYINAVAPEIPVILDGKRADIGNTNEGYVGEAFDFFGADALTVHPYMGRRSLLPILNQKNKGIIVLCRTSNDGADEFQDSQEDIPDEYYTPLYQKVARNVARYWDVHSNCLVVVGATCPEELAIVRKIVGDMTILIPGVGFQQKHISLSEQVRCVVEAGADSKKQGIIVNSSRGIIFASEKSDFPQATRSKTLELHNLLNYHLDNVKRG